MHTNEKMVIMNETAKQVKKMLQSRLSTRLEALKAYEPSTLENLPDEVKIIREQQASPLRAVIQEQKDVLDIITMMFPDA